MSLSSLLATVEIVSALAYSALAVRLLRSGRFVSLPFFCAYCLLMAVDMLWSPTTIRQALWIQPWLLSLRLCAAVEAMSLIADLVGWNQRRYMLLFVLCVGLAGSTAAAGFHNTADMAGWYRAITQGVHVGLAMACGALWLYQAMDRETRWNKVWLPHFRTVAAYMALRAFVSFFATPGRGWAYHSTVRIVFLCGVCAWVVAWLWYDRRELRAAHFHSFQPAP
jgi:hypothetical protein